MANLGEELIRKTLNATLVTCGSKATSGTAAALGSVTAYTGGLFVKNGSATVAEVIWICTTGTATVGGTDCYQLDAGETIPLPVGNLAAISAIAASGTPKISWVGSTL